MLQPRRKSNRQQGFMLALGCGSSVALHLGLIAGICYWWRSPPAVDEPIEITLVEPTDVEPVPIPSAPPLAKPLKIGIVATPSQQVSQPKPNILKPVSKPVVVTSMPKPLVVVVKSIPKPIRSTPQPKPRFSSIKTKVKPNPPSIQTARVNLPVNPKPVPNPFPIEPKIPTTNPAQTSPFTATKSTPNLVQREPKIKPTPNPIANLPQTTAVPTPIPSEIDTNSPRIPVESKFLRAAILTSQPTRSPDPVAPAITSALNSPMSLKSQNRSTPSKQTPDGGKIHNNDNILSQDRSLEGGLTGNGNQLDPSSTGNLQSPNSLLPIAGNGKRGSLSKQNSQLGGSSAPSGDSNPSTSQAAASSGGLQCIQHCEISKLRDLQDRDGGKDRLRIRIVVDPNGLVLTATISKSSDNPQIDEIVLAGIKQMQFKPSGKTIQGIIKANILL